MFSTIFNRRAALFTRFDLAKSDTRVRVERDWLPRRVLGAVLESSAGETLGAVSRDSLSEEYFKENKRSSYDRDAWNHLLKTPAVLATDRVEA